MVVQIFRSYPRKFSKAFIGFLLFNENSACSINCIERFLKTNLTMIFWDFMQKVGDLFVNEFLGENIRGEIEKANHNNLQEAKMMENQENFQITVDKN